MYYLSFNFFYHAAFGWFYGISYLTFNKIFVMYFEHKKEVFNIVIYWLIKTQIKKSKSTDFPPTAITYEYKCFPLTILSYNFPVVLGIIIAKLFKSRNNICLVRKFWWSNSHIKAQLLFRIKNAKHRNYLCCIKAFDKIVCFSCCISRALKLFKCYFHIIAKKIKVRPNRLKRSASLNWFE